MTFDQSILIWCVIVPAGITAGTIALVEKLRSNAATHVPSNLALLVAGLGWWIAIAMALSARNDWRFLPTEYWHRCLLPLIGWCCLTVGVNDPKDRSGRWMFVALVSAITAYVCLPTGEGWEDTYAVHGLVGIAIMLGTLVNAWSLERMARRRAERWVLLVSLASWGGPIALAASYYGSLTEWGVAALSATLVFALFELILNREWAWALASPASAAAICVLAAGRFGTFEEHPTWLYAQVLFLPTIISTFDHWIRRRPTWVRVLAAAGIAVISIAVSTWFVLIRETEAW